MLTGNPTIFEELLHKAILRGVAFSCSISMESKDESQMKAVQQITQWGEQIKPLIPVPVSPKEALGHKIKGSIDAKKFVQQQVMPIVLSEYPLLSEGRVMARSKQETAQKTITQLLEFSLAASSLCQVKLIGGSRGHGKEDHRESDSNPTQAVDVARGKPKRGRKGRDSGVDRGKE